MLLIDEPSLSEKVMIRPVGIGLWLLLANETVWSTAW